MHVVSYGKFAHLLRIFSEATSLTIAFQRHPRMQDRRQTKLWSVHDVMPVGSYGKFAHPLRIFSEATSLTIVFQRHPRMQDRRQTKLRSFHDVMHVGSCGKFAHLLRIFFEATSLTIAFHRHSRMQDRRQTKMWSSWRDACGKLWKIRSPASYFLRGYFAHYSVSETSQNARPTYN